MNIIDILEQYPTARFLFLTLTVKNCDLSDIRSTLSQMSTAFNRMTKSDAFTDVIGYIRNMEITRGENDSVHPHYHVLLMVNQSYFKSGHYISKDGWAKYWRKYMKLNYDPVCDIRLVRDKTKRLDVVKELFKYTIKESDIKTDNWYKILMDSLHHVRAISSGGALKNIIKDDTNLQDHDLLHLTESGSEMQPLNKTVAYQWNRPIKRYRKV
jgi:plasmid rolling circle replication initiator protein Rep